MKSRITLVVVLAALNLFAQDDPRTKTVKDAVGHWQFKPFYRKDDGDRVLQDIYVIMQIDFTAQGHYTFILHDSTVEKGKWNISGDGMTLHFTERNEIPAYAEPLMPLSFPIKIYHRKSIVITFKEFDVDSVARDIRIKFIPIH